MTFAKYLIIDLSFFALQLFYENVTCEKNLVPQLRLKKLSTNQIIVFFDHQYLWKGSVDT